LPRKADAVKAWHAFEREGLKLRTRALTTTLFCRLFLADLFIHGIGGAIYDEVTDEIIRGFYEMEAPGFLTLSATVLLPLPTAARSGPGLNHLRRLLRDLWYNPDRHLGENATPDSLPMALRKKKWELIGRLPVDPVSRWQRFQAFHQINDRLRPFLAQHREARQRELAEAEKTALAHRFAQDREYAFCLYPENLLRGFFDQALNGN
jgi:hypothetical protein